MKHSAVIVSAPQLHQLAPEEARVFTHIVYNAFRGADALHTARWRRWWWRLMRTGMAKFYPVNERSLAFHKRHMAIEERIFEAQEQFTTKAAFRWWLKAKCGFGHFEASAGVLVFVPSSLSIEECSDDELREFHQDAMRFLVTPEALERLWPHVPHRIRLEALDRAIHHEGDS